MTAFTEGLINSINLFFSFSVSLSYIISDNIRLSEIKPNALNMINNGTSISNPKTRTLKVFARLVTLSKILTASALFSLSLFTTKFILFVLED